MSLLETLESLGYRADPIPGEPHARDVARLSDGVVVFSGSSRDIWDWLQFGHMPTAQSKEADQ
jgi:hypothetical protein